MLDLSHIPNSQQDVQIFYAISGSNSWQTWNKPRKCNYVWIMCIGGGGGGASGFGANSSSPPGGASGGVSRALYNAQQLPDRLYVQVGLGGAGGVSGGSSAPGSPGTRSWVALQPAVVAQNLVQGSGAAAAAGGSNVGGNAAGETAVTQATATFLTLSNFISTAGVTSNGFPGGNITPFTSQITCTGAGGGAGSTTAAISGYSIDATPISPRIAGGAGAIASGSNGGRGADGITSWKPFFSLGGAGGGNALSGSGGDGGNGGIGSGGGGGGGFKLGLGYTGGTGGRGGDGLIVIISF